MEEGQLNSILYVRQAVVIPTSLDIWVGSIEEILRAGRVDHTENVTKKITYTVVLRLASQSNKFYPKYICTKNK